MVDKLSLSNQTLSFLGWETVMSSIANHLNNLPLSRPSSRTISRPEYDILTPNKLIHGRNNQRSLIGPLLIDSSPSSVLERIIESQEYFYKLLEKQVHLLVPRNVWSKSDVVNIGDIVLFFIKENTLKPRSQLWHYGMVKEVNGQRLLLSYNIGNSKTFTKKEIVRSKRDVVRICYESEFDYNSRSHFKGIHI